MSSDLERLKGDALFLAGPTASGKSGLALAVAERLAGRGGAEIVNADSMQVFADLRVLSARPSDAETARVPHHLFGCVDADEHYSVGRWLTEATAALGDIAARGGTAIVVGGSGLYFKALTDGLADAPDPGPEARAAASAILEQEGIEALRAKAQALDPEGAAALAPGDRHRLLRLVAYALGHGAPLSKARARNQAPRPTSNLRRFAPRAQTAPPRMPMRWRALVLEPDRAELYRRIDARAEAMLDDGAIEEAMRLAARGLGPDRPALKALGVKVLSQLGRGEISRDAALEALARDTRRYAKRQLTWFRNQTADWPRIDAPDPDAAIATWCGQSPK